MRGFAIKKKSRGEESFFFMEDREDKRCIDVACETFVDWNDNYARLCLTLKEAKRVHAWLGKWIEKRERERVKT